MTYTKKVWENSPSTNTPLNALNLNNIEDGIYNAHKYLNDGWIPDTNTWTYVSATTISINADMTGILQKGDKIKFTQTTAKYFYVVSIGAYTGGATVITVIGGSDYTVANATISNTYYSRVSSPFGFPQWFNWTPVISGVTKGSGTYIGRFNIVGKKLSFYIKVTFNSTSITGPVRITPPINGASTFGASFPMIISDTGAKFYNGACVLFPTSMEIYVTLANETYSANSELGATVPHTWANSDYFAFAGQYEIA